MCNDNGIRPYGPGKFDTVLDSIVYQQSLDGCDEECGSVTECGIWYGKLSAPILDLSDDLLRDDHELSQLTQDERDLISNSAGCIISEDDQGFVSVEYFTATEELDAAWSDCEDETALDDEEEV